MGGDQGGIRLPLDSGEDGHFLILQMGKLRPRAGLSHKYTMRMMTITVI